MSSYYYSYSGGPGGQQHHFLDACSLCGKLLGFNSDIFMYRGNSPYCSNECRQEQIEMDEAEEKKKWKKLMSSSSSSSSGRRSAMESEGKKSGSAKRKTLPTETVVVA